MRRQPGLRAVNIREIVIFSRASREEAFALIASLERKKNVVLASVHNMVPARPAVPGKGRAKGRAATPEGPAKESVAWIVFDASLLDELRAELIQTELE
jgi:hypothetical protein